MKKIISIAAILAVFSNASAFAKTEGNYFGFDVLKANTKQRYTNDIGTKFKDSNIGYGFNYKHAFNFDKVFVAPGVFFDHLGTSGIDYAGDRVNVKNRYGVKFDIGYDLTDKAAVYFTNGISSTSYNMDFTGTDLGSKSGSKTAYFFGAGASYEVAKNWLANFEYNHQKLSDIKGPNGTRADASVGVVKVGVAYHF